MLIGYNTNVPYKGTLYHVQTEDSGLKTPVVITLLYLKGTILASKKTNYSDLAGSPDYKEKVRELMKEQHKAMIKELIAGKHTGKETPPEPGNIPGPKNENVASEQTQNNAKQQGAPESQISKSLDDILLDYIIRSDK
jgi:hypothetical protein